jgi:hypothetical protein
MVIFHSYVSLPEGKHIGHIRKALVTLAFHGDV